MTVWSNSGWRWVAFLAFAALSACEKPKQPGTSACELLAAEQCACDASVEACEGDAAECKAECLVGLACEDLVDPWKEPGAVACMSNCAQKFTCGDGTRIPKKWTCDRTLDCPEGEDEAECD